jgi:energy-coupling factor transport system ATP-binding protein
MLDPEGADSVRAAIKRVVVERRATLVVVEHRLEPWLDFVDRLIVLQAGAVVADGRPDAVLEEHGKRLAESGVWTPGAPMPRPLSLDAETFAPRRRVEGAVVETRQVTVALPVGLIGRRDRQIALHDLDSAVEAGRAVAITGRSGAGKSTLLAALGGVIRPTAGHVEAAAALATSRGSSPWRWTSRDLAARLAWTPQAVEQGIVATTVLDEVQAAGRAIGLPTEWLTARAESLIDQLGLTHLAGASPYHLSGGEQRRLMVAAALAHGPTAVLLDEPTVGQDRNTWAAVVGALASARDAGAGVALSTHDALAVDVLAADEIVLDAGRRVR